MTVEDEPNRGSHQYRESAQLMIPKSGYKAYRPKRHEPLVLRLPVVIALPTLMVAIGIALEVALFFSKRNNGFHVPEKNVFSTLSTQFLLSFVPTLFVIPLAFLWRSMDWMLRWNQPYVVLSKGNAKAEDSLLLDYMALGPLVVMFRAMKRRHYIVFWSAVTAGGTFLLQPLTSAIFQVRQTPGTQSNAITSLRDVGLIQDVNQLNAFVAAAGFAEAAVFHGLPDPPFIHGTWATAEFTFPTPLGFNGTMVTNTTGVQTSTNCANPVGLPIITTVALNNMSITSTSIFGCSQSVFFDPNSSVQQYGVVDVPCPGSASSDAVSLRPVMFWYFHHLSNQDMEARTVFCNPTISVQNITATVNLNDGSLTDVQPLSARLPSNNVTGAPLFGRAFNGVVFSPNNDKFIQARATATASGVSGAVFRFASQLPNGTQSVFDDPNGFTDITTKVYTQHLSITAKSIYFVGANNTIPSQLTSYVPRLWIDALPARFLSVLLILMGLLGSVLHLIHYRDRRKFRLSAAPGSIAAVMSMTSRSGFGELLAPHDDDVALQHKLEGLRFRMDRMTGDITADESFTPRRQPPIGDSSSGLFPSNAKFDPHRSMVSTPSSYSLERVHTPEYPPSERTLRTPYDP